ncbi:hypothetical protein LTR28_011756 [Elasticomyces elasticus]|nr:hypothetical protein LTR28_011756 [Elasticomyces elasticus]
MLGSTANWQRADNTSASLIERRDIVHDKASKELRRVKQEAMAAGGKEGRVQWFLRQRDAAMGVGVEDAREERARKMLGQPECWSDE